MMLLAAVTRDDVANYVGDLFGVYIVLLLIYILDQLRVRVRPAACLLART